jgi:hypothetical protein
MSGYGNEWREHDGDVLPPDDALFDGNDNDAIDYDAIVDAATKFVNAADEPERNYALEQSIAAEYGPEYTAAARQIKEDLEQSAGYPEGRKIQLNGQWVSKAQFASGELYRMRGRGGITSKGFNELWELLGMPLPGGGTDSEADEPTDVPDTGVRHDVYQDARKAAAHDF